MCVFFGCHLFLSLHGNPRTRGTVENCFLQQETEAEKTKDVPTLSLQCWRVLCTWRLHEDGGRVWPSGLGFCIEVFAAPSVVPGTSERGPGSADPCLSGPGPARPSTPPHVVPLPELKPENALFEVFLRHLSPISKK